MEPTVKLWSHTAHPAETLWAVWTASKTNDSIPPVDAVVARREEDPGFAEEVDNLFGRLLETHVPILEMVDFVFIIDGVSIALREQMVRHRVGHKFAHDRIDSFPDLPDSSWWSQSMRITDMGRFAHDGYFRIPRSVQECKAKIEDAGALISAEEYWKRKMRIIENAYRNLRTAGVPEEDARGLIPLDATHRLTWKCNAASLAHIVAHRTCWFVQMDLWEPVIMGMLNEVAAVHHAFRRLVKPPCIKGDAYHKCTIPQEQINRVLGKDPLPPCPLFLSQEGRDTGDAPGAEWRREGVQLVCIGQNAERRMAEAEQREARFERYWGRNTRTGVPLPVLR